MRGIKTNGEQLRQLRQARGWTQEEMASAVGCSERTIRNAERGERIDLGTLRQMAECLSVDLVAVSCPLDSDQQELDRNKQVVLDWEAAMIAADVDRVMTFYAPQAVEIIPGSAGLPGVGRADGIAQVREHMAAALSAFEILSIKQRKIDATENMVFHRVEAVLRAQPTGRTFEATILNEIELENQKIVSRLVLADLTLYRDALLPEVPADQRQRIVETWVNAYAAQDVEKIIQMLTDDVIIEIPGSNDLPGGGAFRGLAAARKHLESTFAEVKCDPLQRHEYELHTVDECVFLRGWASAAILATGQRFTAYVTHEFRFRGEKISQIVTVFDTAGMRDALE